jgi:hypothetical protein
MKPLLPNLPLMIHETNLFILKFKSHFWQVAHKLLTFEREEINPASRGLS